MTCWDNYHMPVNGAGFFLCPLHFDALCEKKHKDAEEFDNLKADAVDVLCTMFRRWDPLETSVRKKILEPGDERVADYREKITTALENYVLLEEEWEGFNMTPFKTGTTNPLRFWQMKAPPKSILRLPAARICNLDVVSSDVERSHVITKANRTKKRNRLDYELNQALTFGKLELMHGSGLSKRMDWKDLVSFHEKFMAVSDEEHKWAEELAAKWAQEAAKDAAQQDTPTELADASASTEVTLELVEAEPLDLRKSSVSAHGRVRRRRYFGDDFARLDDDGGLPDA